MIIYFLLFFRLQFIRENDHKSIKYLSWSRRISIYFYSKKNISEFDIDLRKQWDLFSSLLEKNKKEGTCDIDFDKNVEFSEYYLVKENDLPCFLILDHQTVSLFTKKDIIAAYNSHNSINETKSSKNKNILDEHNIFFKLLNNYTNNNLLKEVCQDFSPKSANYPAFVFQANDIQRCKKIRKYSYLIPQLSNHFYFSEKVSAGEFYFYMNKKDYMIKKFKSSRAIDTIREYSYFPFDNSWSLINIRQIKDRRVAFVVYSNKTNHPLYNLNVENESMQQKNIKEVENKILRKMISDLSNLFWRDIVFNIMTLDDFNLLKVKMKESDTPFIFVTNPRKSKFLIIKDISTSNRVAIISKLKKVKRGVFDNEMKNNFEPILSVYYENTRTLANTLCFTLAAFIVVAFTTFVIVKRASVCINPQNQIIHRRKHNF